MKKDLVIIGSGPGGYVAAVRAAQKGLDVALVEKNSLGGVCLNWGCIPTKALYKNALAVKEVENSEEMGIKIDDYQLDFAQMQQRKSQVVNRLTGGVDYLLNNHGVEVIKGVGKITEQDTVQVENGTEKKEIRAENIIIATGSEPILPPIDGIESSRVLTSKELLGIEEIPEELAIIGGGVIGVEFASIFSTLGSKVYIVEMMDQLLPNMDRELANKLKKELVDQGIEVRTKTEVTEIKELSSQLTIKTASSGEITAEKALAAVGRKPLLPEINDKLKVVTNDQGQIEVDDYLETSTDNIYAIGDVIGNYQLAHVASQEGIVAVKNILGEKEEMDYKVVPSAVFSLPEVASVGLTEKEARQRYDIKVGKFPYNANGKALALGAEEGFVKIITDKKWDEILGVHILGYDASTLVSEGGLALKLEATAEELADTIHAHPTLPEIVMEAAEDVNGLSIHKP